MSFPQLGKEHLGTLPLSMPQCSRPPARMLGGKLDSPRSLDPEGPRWGKAAPTSSSCSSWDALLPRGAGGAAPPGGGGGARTPSSSTTRAGAHAAGSRVPRAPPGGGGGCRREKPRGSPSSDRVSEPEEDSAEEAPGEDATATARTGVRTPWLLQLRGTGSDASETFSPISLSGPKCDPRGDARATRTPILPGKPQAARL